MAFFPIFRGHVFNYHGAPSHLRGGESFEEVWPFGYFLGILGPVKDPAIAGLDEHFVPLLIGFEGSGKHPVDRWIRCCFHQGASLKITPQPP
jgi:hypothetical protein